MLMHLRFCLESIPVKQKPAAILRYYRLQKGITTRQLAEIVGIVPATLLMYEREKFPIPYQTAIAMAKALRIDRHLLFDDFARFIDAPYSERLQAVRKEYRLNQTDFAAKAEINCYIYSKWESGARRPSRTMFEKLIAVYPEIKL